VSVVSTLPERSDQGFVEEAIKVVDAARERGTVLRIMGATAIRIHCPKFSYFYEALQREITDIDLVGYEKQKSDVLKLLEDMGYFADRRMRMLHLLGRYTFQNPNSKRYIDVFFDKLEMCHTIDFRGRLEIDCPTISLSDLFLEKMQIVEINEKDIRDVMVLLREHEIAREGKEAIDCGYITTLLSRDWGFYYTVTTNLGKMQAFFPEYEALSAEDRSDISAKIDSLSKAIEKSEKSLMWKIRAKTGTKKQWYRSVEDTGL